MGLAPGAGQLRRSCRRPAPAACPWITSLRPSDGRAVGSPSPSRTLKWTGTHTRTLCRRLPLPDPPPAMELCGGTRLARCRRRRLRCPVSPMSEYDRSRKSSKGSISQAIEGLAGEGVPPHKHAFRARRPSVFAGAIGYLRPGRGSGTPNVYATAVSPVRGTATHWRVCGILQWRYTHVSARAVRHSYYRGARTRCNEVGIPRHHARCGGRASRSPQTHRQRAHYLLALESGLSSHQDRATRSTKRTKTWAKKGVAASTDRPPLQRSSRK